MIVGHRQEFCLAFCDPRLGLFLMATRAVSILAGVVTVDVLFTVGTPVDMAAECFGTTLANRLDCPTMAGQDALSILPQVRLAVASHHLTQ